VLIGNLSSKEHKVVVVTLGHPSNWQAAARTSQNATRPELVTVTATYLGATSGFLQTDAVQVWAIDWKVKCAEQPVTDCKRTAPLQGWDQEIYSPNLLPAES
jgi:hypothetical protein